MNFLRANGMKLFMILKEVITLSIERTWIPLSLGMNRHWLARIDVNSNQQVPPKVILIPYATPACRFQHKSLAAHIRRNGQAISFLAEFPNFSESDRQNNSQDLSFESFADLTQGLIELCQGDSILATGAIDSFMATCPPNTFFENFSVPKEFIELVYKTKEWAQDLILGCSAIVLADGAYIYNRALISSALNAGVKVYIFNPDGDWVKFTRKHGENTKDFASYLSSLSPEAYANALAEADVYLDSRFKGKQTDLDSPGVFSEISDPIYVSPKKVLFMHVFRDANQLQVGQESFQQSLFGSYFEWADFCLQEVAKNPKEWQVKLHPSSKFYPGEIEIQIQLLEKHGISMDIVDSCPTTHQILQNRWPIFTHSGTIALESAVFGYRSNVCSTRHPEQLAHIARSKSQLMEQLRKQPNEIENSLEAEDIEMARLLLTWTFRRDLPNLTPKNPQPDRRSFFRYHASTLVQEFSLMRRYIKPSVQLQLQKMALELITIRTDNFK